jgi:hypothetical protein
MSQRIAELEPRISTMQGTVTGAMHQQETALVTLAVDELQAQKDRLSSYRIQARFALANMYDRAAAAASQSPRRSQGAPKP